MFQFPLKNVLNYEDNIYHQKLANLKKTRLI